MTRHFTATGYLTWKGGVFLHRHPKINLWLPPGGHIEINEDPAEAVIREIKEETGLLAAIFETPTSKELNFDYPKSIVPPRFILEEDIDDPIDGFHNHIDMIYYCQPVKGIDQLLPGWRLFGYKELKKAHKIYEHDKDGFDTYIHPPVDVITVGINAIESTS
ncbi:MAG: NUDIX domain-containing protein [SAR202 cluster bacterium]|nr:MAG: NUDIX domain-containing protein [SAR202 cluster bacterium]MEC8986623.1 NUDIX domain-containing protein [Chloroflexota bacterium]